MIASLTTRLGTYVSRFAKTLELLMSNLSLPPVLNLIWSGLNCNLVSVSPLWKRLSSIPISCIVEVPEGSAT